MVIEVRVQLRAPAARRREQSSFGRAQVREQVVRRAPRRGEVALVAEHLIRLRERRDHQAVPAREDLVVRARLDAQLARREQFRARLNHGRLELAALEFQARRDLVRRLRPPQRTAPVLEVALVGDVPPLGGPAPDARAEHEVELLRRPDEELALLALAVGVLRAREGALGRHHLAQHPLAALARDPRVLGVARREVALEVRRHEQRVVVEHLLEVGDQPLLVGRVAMEAPAELVVHAARSHAIERVRGHGQRGRILRAQPVTQHEPDVHGVRELGRAAEAAPLGVVVLAEHGVGQRERVRVEVACRHLRLADHVAERAAALGDALAIVAPGEAQRLHDLRPARASVAAHGREVGAAEERLELRREEHAHGPAARARHGLHGLHVDVVEVRALLAVDLDVDEVLVHQRRDLRVLEALVLHHVAPVAGRVPDREEDRLLFPPRALERLGAPGVPVHRIRGVLEQVGARLLGEAIAGGGARARHGSFSVRFWLVWLSIHRAATGREQDEHEHRTHGAAKSRPQRPRALRAKKKQPRDARGAAPVSWLTLPPFRDARGPWRG